MSKVLKLMRAESYSHPNFPHSPIYRGDTVMVDDDFAEELMAKGKNGEGPADEGEANFIPYFQELPGLSDAKYNFTEEHMSGNAPVNKPTARLANWRKNVPNDKTVTNSQGQVVKSLAAEEETDSLAGDAQDAGKPRELVEGDPAETHHPQDQPQGDDDGEGEENVDKPTATVQRTRPAAKKAAR